MMPTTETESRLRRLSFITLLTLKTELMWFQFLVDDEIYRKTRHRPKPEEMFK